MDHYCQTLYIKEKLFKTSAVFEEDSLKLTLFENNGTAWNTNIQKEEIIKQSNDNDFKEYYDKLKRYLKSCPKDVEFNFMHGKFTISLLLTNNMKMLFFTSTLNQVDFVENILFLVDKLNNDKTQYFEELSSLKKQLQVLNKDNNILREKLDTFLEKRKSEEQQIYSKFMILLNEKKQHVQHLSDILSAFRKGRLTSVNKGKTNDIPQKNTTTKRIITDSEGSSLDNFNTENEEVNNISCILTPKTSKPNPSIPKSKASFIEDSPATSFTFSKRIRTDTSLSVHLPENITKELTEVKNTINNDSKKASHELTPTVNFNTQDLLDNL